MLLFGQAFFISNLVTGHGTKNRFGIDISNWSFYGATTKHKTRSTKQRSWNLTRISPGELPVRLLVDGSEILVGNHLLSMKPLKKGCDILHISTRRISEPCLPSCTILLATRCWVRWCQKLSAKWWEKWWFVCLKKYKRQSTSKFGEISISSFNDPPWNEASFSPPLKNRLWDKGSLTYSAKGPWNESSNFIFPTNVIPKSFSVSHWLSKLILLPIFLGQS